MKTENLVTLKECFTEEICQLLVEGTHLSAFMTQCVRILLLNLIILLIVMVISCQVNGKIIWEGCRRR
jgi:hypothetical protein